MNDIGYINCEYKGSTAYNSIMSASKECLLYRLGYTKGAIEYHTKENNPRQIKFLVMN